MIYKISMIYVCCLFTTIFLGILPTVFDMQTGVATLIRSSICMYNCEFYAILFISIHYKLLHACIRTYMHTHINTHTHTHTHTHIHIHTHIHSHMHTHTNTHTNTCTHLHTRT